MHCIKRLRTHRTIPADWHTHLVRIWSEDNNCRLAGDDSREMVETAWERIIGQTLNHLNCCRVHENGETKYSLHWDGWVYASSYDGDHIYLALTLKETNS